MKIAISARGPSLDSDVDPRFGRSAGFVLYDDASGETTYLDNVAPSGAGQGAGIRTAQMVAEAGAEVLITGQMGPKAAQVLERTGLKVYLRTGGMVREAVEALGRNELAPFSSEKIQAGPGKMGGRGLGGGGRGMGGGGGYAQGGRGRGRGSS
jgi:predicted Fe-Mo cluster-binding NifX family protein